MNTKIALVVVGLIAGALVGSLPPVQARLGSMMSYRSPGTTTLNTNTTYNGVDKHFIEQMIPHHDGAIAMSKLALERSKSTEVRALAQAIIDAQTRENQQMRTWYRTWYGADVPTANTNSGGMMSGGMMSGSGMHMGGREDLDSLRSATNFDKAFIEQMIPHHQMAIMMARMLAAGTTRPEMTEFSKAIISAQSSEITQMQLWYTNWYKQPSR